MKMLVTDLDGTLLNDQHQISDADHDMLEELGRRGVIRVAATGRSVYSWRRVADAAFPFDYLIFSCGSGIITWPDENLIKEHAMPDEMVARAVDVLDQCGLSYQVHAEIPDNHQFHCFTNVEHDDYLRRCSLYEEHILSENADRAGLSGVCQILAITDADNVHLFDLVKKELPELQVIRATSPLDGESLWIELYPAGVSKGHALEWLCQRLSLDIKTDVVGVGNDYNDTDFLDLVGNPYIVSNAPLELLERYTVVASNNCNGVSDAVERSMIT